MNLILLLIKFFITKRFTFPFQSSYKKENMDLMSFVVVSYNFSVASQFQIKRSVFKIFISRCNVFTSAFLLGFGKRCSFWCFPRSCFCWHATSTGSWWITFWVNRQRVWWGAHFRNWKHTFQWKVCQETLQVQDFQFWDSFLALTLCWYQLSECDLKQMSRFPLHQFHSC